MRMVDIATTDNKELSKEEIQFFVNGYTNGEIPDYQASVNDSSIFQRYDI